MLDINSWFGPKGEEVTFAIYFIFLKRCYLLEQNDVFYPMTFITA